VVEDASSDCGVDRKRDFGSDSCHGDGGVDGKGRASPARLLQ
jgi:hypothetical protein